MSILREELITNHLLLDYFDLWDEFDIRKVDDPKTVRYYDLLMNHIQNQIDAGVKWLESDEARDYFYGESEYQREVFRALEDEWDSILEGKYPSVEALLSEVYRRGKAQGYSDMREHIRYTEQDKLALEFVTNYNFDLIRNIDYDTRSQIKGKITEAVIAGNHPYTVAPKILDVAEERLDGSNFTPKQRATMIARTEISRVQNTGILQSYVNEGYTEVNILTAEDDHVCDLCLKYAFEFNDDDITFENRGKERVHNISKLIKGGCFPPFHPLCRCTYLSVWKGGEKYDGDAEIMDLISYAPNNSNNQNFSKNTIQEFNELKDDPNIEWSIDEKVVFDVDGLYNHEPFIKYHFKDSGLTIYKSIFNDVASVKEIEKFYKEYLPKELTSVCDEIVLSYQMLQKESEGELKYVPGFTKRGHLNRINILNYPNFSSDEIKRTITHELAHTIDGKNFKYSNSSEYEKIYNKCKQELLDKKIYKGTQLYISEYSQKFTNNALNGGDGAHRPYSEDFAECVVEYIHNPKHIFQQFPEKGDYINNILHNYTQDEVKKLKGEK
ncbi:phage minor head protein [Methanobrevibacter sp.]